MAASIFKFGDKFGIESPFENKSDKLVIAKLIFTEIEVIKNDRVVEKPESNLPIIVIVQCNNRPFDMKITFENEVSNMIFNSSKNQYEAYYFLDLLSFDEDKVCAFYIKANNKNNKVIAKKTIKKNLSALMDSLI